MSDTSSSGASAHEGGSSQPAAGAAVPFTRVYHSAMSAFAEPVELVVRSSSGWQRAWVSAHPNRAAGPPPAPAVDFATDLVVLVSAGTQPTGGVSLQVDGVRARADGTTEVAYTVTRPGAGCMSTQQLTAPIEIIRTRRTAGEVRFARRDASAPC